VKGLSIIIPIFKEKDNFEALVKKIYKNLKKIKINKKYCEVIFIDDSSNDGVDEIYNKIKKNYYGLKLNVRKEKPRDLSKSCIYGFKKSKFDKILVMDGDLQHDPIYIPYLYNKILFNNLDLVIGTRNFNNRENIKLSFVRFLLSKFLILIMNKLLGKKSKDPMSGFFIFKKIIYLKSKKKLFGKGYKILSDILYSSNQSIKSCDIDIFFKSRSKNSSKLGFKVLFYIVQFIIIKFFTTQKR
tara:strand:+ start:1155 stop:1880 length:726 start_codon:yes stop_codon:yes gene_type:complete